MKTPFIRLVDNQEIGYADDGEKLTILGQIIDFREFNEICVLKAEKDGEVELAFMELNETQNDVVQIQNDEVISELKELWGVTKIVDTVATKLNVSGTQ